MRRALRRPDILGQSRPSEMFRTISKPLSNQSHCKRGAQPCIMAACAGQMARGPVTEMNDDSIDIARRSRPGLRGEAT
jgi:hypothetical protein